MRVNVVGVGGWPCWTRDSGFRPEIKGQMVSPPVWAGWASGALVSACRGERPQLILEGKKECVGAVGSCAQLLRRTRGGRFLETRDAAQCFCCC